MLAARAAFDPVWLERVRDATASERLLACRLGFLEGPRGSMQAKVTCTSQLGISAGAICRAQPPAQHGEAAAAAADSWEG